MKNVKLVINVSISKNIEIFKGNIFMVLLRSDVSTCKIILAVVLRF